MREATDKIWLWNEIRYSNEKAFYRLYMDSFDHLFRFGLSVTPDRDKVMACINEIFAEIWEKRNSLPEVEKVDGYLFIMYKRKLNRLVQQRQPVYSVPNEGLLVFSQEDASYEELLIASQAEAEQKIKVQRALAALTARQKELIRLKYFDGLSFEEISDRLQISLRTIYNTIHTAITILRKELQNNT